jgi:hypothetical protein
MMTVRAGSATPRAAAGPDGTEHVPAGHQVAVAPLTLASQGSGSALACSRML